MTHELSDEENSAILDEAMYEYEHSLQEELQEESEDVPDEPCLNCVTVVKNIDENNIDHDDWLYAYHDLLKPIPLTQWPENRRWAQSLYSEFPWMENIIRKIERQNVMSQHMASDALTIAPILLVGKPGIGKTNFLRRLGELLAVPTVFLPLAGSSDNLMLRGSSRNFTHSRPGILVDTMNEHKIANPLVILDEIDKVSEGQQHGRVWEAVLSMVDPSGNQHIMDECLRGEVDYSRVNWLATANSIAHLPAPLRSRFSIIEVDTPRAEDYAAVVYNIKKMIADKYHTYVEFLPELDPKVCQKLRFRFENKQFSLRNMYKVISELMEIAITAEEHCGSAPLKKQHVLH